jgi:cell division protein FtsI (penicillin-binding protein 3)
VTNPRIVVVVTLNSTPEQGGLAAAPVFSKIAETALRILQVPKDDPDSDRRTMEPEPPGAGQPVYEEQPSPVAAAPPVAKPASAVETRSRRTDVAGPRVPDFHGKPMVAVMRDAAALGIPLEVVGTGVAREQSPLPGTILPVGASIHVVFARSQ